MKVSYFKAEDHGLEHVGAVDWLRGEGCYEWEDTTVLYHRETNMFYWETAGGCSCNYALDDVESLADLQWGTFHELTEHINKVREEKKVGDGLYFLEDTEGVLDMEVTRVIEAAMRIQEGPWE